MLVMYFRKYFFKESTIDNILVSSIFLMFHVKIPCNDYSRHVFPNSPPTDGTFVMMYQSISIILLPYSIFSILGL